MKTKELKDKGPEELKLLLEEQRARILEIKMRGISSKAKNVKEAKELKKTVARIMTLIKQKNK